MSLIDPGRIMEGQYVPCHALKVKLMRPNAKAPTKAKEGDAGWDLYLCGEPEVKHFVGFDLYRLPTGVAVEIPSGYFMRLAPRSGKSWEMGCWTTAGVIDAGYRGEVMVLLCVPHVLEEVPHFGEDGGSYMVHHLQRNQALDLKDGDKIAQALILPVPLFQVEVVKELSESQRGGSGWGSSGR